MNPNPVSVGWLQAFNQVYPGAAQYVQNAQAFMAGAAQPRLTRGPSPRWGGFAAHPQPVPPGPQRPQAPLQPNPSALGWAAIGVGTAAVAGLGYAAYRSNKAWTACQPDPELVPGGAWLDETGELAADAVNALIAAFKAIVGELMGGETDPLNLAYSAIDRVSVDPENCRVPRMAIGKVGDLKRHVIRLARDWLGLEERAGNPRVKNAGCYPGVEAAIGLDPSVYGFWPGYNYFYPPQQGYSSACPTGQLMCHDPNTGENACREECLPGEQSLPVARTGDYGPPARAHNRGQIPSGLYPKGARKPNGLVTFAIGRANQRAAEARAAAAAPPALPSNGVPLPGTPVPGPAVPTPEQPPLMTPESCDYQIVVDGNVQCCYAKWIPAWNSYLEVCNDTGEQTRCVWGPACIGSKCVTPYIDKAWVEVQVEPQKGQAGRGMLRIAGPENDRPVRIWALKPEVGKPDRYVACYSHDPRPRTPSQLRHPNQAGTIGPALGLSPFVYGQPGPWSPPLALQPHFPANNPVGVVPRAGSPMGTHPGRAASLRSLNPPTVLDWRPPASSPYPPSLDYESSQYGPRVMNLPPSDVLRTCSTLCASNTDATPKQVAECYDQCVAIAMKFKDKGDQGARRVPQSLVAPTRPTGMYAYPRGSQYAPTRSIQPGLPQNAPAVPPGMLVSPLQTIVVGALADDDDDSVSVGGKAARLARNMWGAMASCSGGKKTCGKSLDFRDPSSMMAHQGQPAPEQQQQPQPPPPQPNNYRQHPSYQASRGWRVFPTPQRVHMPYYNPRWNTAGGGTL